MGLVLPVRAVEFWVSSTGCDTNAGTKESPLLTVETAQRRARDLRRLKDPSISNGVHIILRGGVYRQHGPLYFRWEDSGTESSPTVVEAAPGEEPILCAGVVLHDWKKVTGDVPGLSAAARGKVWASEIPRLGGRPLEPRQLWVDERKAVRARDPNGDGMARLVTWDKHNEEAGIPTSYAGPFRDLPRMEMVIHQQWEIANLRFKSLSPESNQVRVTFQQPESRVQFEHPWPAPVMTNGGAPFFLANAVEFLDQPGEWFQETFGGRILYWPRPGEDMTRALVLVPALENLVQVEGTLDRPVAHLQFKGISFRHTAWTRPSEFGHVPLQASMYFIEAYKLAVHGTEDKKGLENQAWLGRPPAAVTVSAAHHVRFERCDFQHMAITGLDFVSGTHDDVIEGCVFRDIGGNAILMGAIPDKGVETHIPYDPVDGREVCRRERIANNLITDCANEDWGCLGICVGYARDVTIEHNELSNLPYSGVSLGWGWTRTVNCMRNNRVTANHIHHFGQEMCDFGGIYTLSAQPGTIVSSNALHSVQVRPYVHDPEHWFWLYTDEGSLYVNVYDNWTETTNFFNNNKGQGIIWTNNGPQVSLEIKDAAGLEPAFRDLLEGNSGDAGKTNASGSCQYQGLTPF